MHRPPIQVSILKPTEASTIDAEFAQTIVDVGGADHRTRDHLICTFIIHEVREMIEEMADQLKMNVRINEYRGYYEEADKLVLSKKDATEVLSHDITVVVDPPEKELAFAATTKHNPLRRILAAFSTKDALEESFSALGALRVPLATPADDENIRMTPKAFGVHVPTYPDDAASAFQSNCSVVEQALLYPHTRTLKTNRKRYFGFE